MRNKLIAVVAASVLALGFAASASASTTADHEVTFRIADARSISVAVLAGGGGSVLDLGTVGSNVNGPKLEDAVAVTFRATDAVNTGTSVKITAQLRVKNGDGILGDGVTPTGFYVIATPVEIPGLPAPGSENNEKGTPYVDNGNDYLYRGLNKPEGFDDTTFNVAYNIDTRRPGTTLGTFNYFIRYTLTDN